MKTTPIAFTKVPSLHELKSGYPNVKALFFDMDGTLFNTEAYHADALLMIGAKYKIRPPYSPEVVHGIMMGKADHLIFDIVRSWEGFPQDWSVSDFVDEKNKNLISILSKTDPIHYFAKEVLNLLDEAKKEKLFLALITSSEKMITQELLRVTGIREYFNLILTRDDCPLHKPDPWPYLKALNLSQVDKTETIIFEDSQVGLEAALNSGAHVIKVEWY